MRFLRMCVKCKGAFQIVFGLICFFFIGLCVYHIGRWSINAVGYCYHAYILDDLDCSYNYSVKIGRDFVFYENGSHGFIENASKGKRILKNVWWVAGADTEDSLLCFASKSYRGYFNRNSGKVVIPADRYLKAWLFSEGLAAVMEKDSIIRFIDPQGKIIIDTQLRYAERPAGCGYVFKNGYCPMRGFNGRWGLINKQSRWAVEPEYEDIDMTRMKYWKCEKDGKQGLLNDSLRLVLTPDYREVLVTDNGIEILKEDYTRQLLDFNGTLLEPCMYTDIRDLYYKSGVVDPNCEEYEYELSPYKEYQTTYSFSGTLRVGLMGPDGRPVTPPLYSSIEAVNKDCFRCIYDEVGHYYEGERASVLINANGQVINK